MKKHKIAKSVVILFCQQISSLLAAGVPLLPALGAFIRHLPGSKRAAPFRQLAEYLGQGSSFGEALAKTGGFPDELVRLVQASEPIGRIGLALEQVRQDLEEKSSLGQQLFFSLFYPSLIILGSLALVIFWLVFLLPTFQQVFAQAGLDLPAVTKTLLAGAGFLQRYWSFLLAGLFTFILILALSWRTGPGQRRLSGLAQRLPGARNLIRKSVEARLGETLSALLKSGLALLPALEISRQAIGFAPARERLIWAIRNLKTGHSLTDSLRLTGLFSSFYIISLASGEASGRLPEILEQLGRQSRAEVKRSLKLLSSFLEPAATAGAGLLVAFVILSLFLPLVSLTSSIQ